MSLTPDQVPAVIARLARLEQWIRGSRAEQDKDNADALALAQQALREWVPRGDREQALELAWGCVDHDEPEWAEARRLLKLEDPADAT